MFGDDNCSPHHVTAPTQQETKRLPHSSFVFPAGLGKGHIARVSVLSNPASDWWYRANATRRWDVRPKI